jgi:hypothetical protein
MFYFMDLCIYIFQIDNTSHPQVIYTFVLSIQILLKCSSCFEMNLKLKKRKKI